jgi:hypothetical protein
VSVDDVVPLFNSITYPSAAGIPYAQADSVPDPIVRMRYHHIFFGQSFRYLGNQTVSMAPTFTARMLALPACNTADDGIEN